MMRFAFLLVFFFALIVLTRYHTMPHFDTLKIYSGGKHCEKGETDCEKQFLLFSQCFLPCLALISHFK